MLDVVDNYKGNPQPKGEVTSFTFNAASEAEFQKLIQAYPTSEAAMIPTLWIVQRQAGFLPEVAMEYVAQRLEVPLSKVLGVATFYTMFKLEPPAKYDVAICQTVCCWLRGSEALIKHAERALGIRAGQTTADGKICLKRVECLASCHTAPVVQVNREDFLENISPEMFDDIVRRLK